MTDNTNAETTRSQHDSTPFALSLQEIAAWQFPELVKEKWPEGKPLAGIPSLQRGAVWKPSQIELIWDSIFRGFPIGSLVVAESKPLTQAKQKTRSGKYGAGWDEKYVTHHLLDGQQRGNAIALGFLDPFAPDGSHSEADQSWQKISASLWLDIAPKKPPSGSTRVFVFRVTTQSHIWGYRLADNATPLEAGKIRKAKGDYLKNLKDHPPSVIDAWPLDAVAPVPVAWLMRFATSRSEKPVSASLDEITNFILAECKKLPEKPWAKTVTNTLAESSEHLTQILCGLNRAMQARVIALEVPTDVITTTSFQESNADGVNQENSESGASITNVEHLFDRLNSKGTPLQGDELVYSMIKAYWPGIEITFEELQKRGHNGVGLPMPEAQLALLATRAALIELKKDNDKLPGALSVGSFRALAYANDGVKEYLGIDMQDTQIAACTLHRVVKLVDSWLLYDAKDHNIGLPPVLRTTVARKTPDVYLLLMWLAKKALDYCDGDISDLTKKRILALTTTLQWFGSDSPKVVRRLYPLLQKKIDEQRTIDASYFEGILSEFSKPGSEDQSMLTVFWPDRLNYYLLKWLKVDGDTITKWTWWNRLVGSGSDNDDFRQHHLMPFIDRLRHNKMLLIYGQRELMNKRFKNYDPSRPDLWEDHNRPWDFDHLLAQYQVSYNQGKFREVCYQWLDCIGNLQVVSFEENRSWQADKTDTKLKDPEEIKLALFENPEEIKKFSLDRDDINDGAKVADFISAARDRLLRIYSAWFKDLDVAYLYHDVTQEISNESEQREL